MSDAPVRSSVADGVTAARAGRYIFIGDIHGCYDELCDLLETIGVKETDTVVSLGDLARKGPHADRCIDLFIERRYEAVLGNNDAKLLARAKHPLKRLFASRDEAAVMREAHRVRFLQSLPLFLDFPDAGVVAVHGGILPNDKRFGAALVTRHAALELRHVRRDDDGCWSPVLKGTETDADPFWADVWNGDRLVVYGHTPYREPRVHTRAIGLDTGCVYGGSLSAAVYDGPRKWQLVSVPARARYAR